MRGIGRLSVNWALLALPLIAAATHAETYYVRNGGDDTADGRSDATAWATIGKVNSYSFKTGDNVLFLEGDVFSGAELNVDWSGTSSQRVVIGAYYVENGTAHEGLRGQRPTFDGKDKRPSTRWVGLVNVLSDYVRVENLAFVNSEGMGVRCKDANFVQAVNVETRNTYDAGIRFDGCKDGLIADSRVTDAARSWPEDGTSLPSAYRWASAIVAHNGASRVVIQRNVVSKVFGEGINVHHGTADAIIEDNFVFGARAVGIYVDSSPNVTVRRNMVVGSSDPAYWRYDHSAGPGIALNDEPFQYDGSNALPTDVQAQNTKIYANAVAYTSSGIAFWGSSGNSFDNTRIYNNSLIDNEVQLSTSGNPMPSSQFVNNILYSVTSGTVDVKGTAWDGLTAKDNYFSKGDPGAPFSDPGNLYSGLQLVRMTGWRDITSPDQVSQHDFSPTPTSTTNGEGASVADFAALDTDVTLDLESKPLNDPVDMGAVRKQTSKTPKSPGQFNARP